jgi:alcohol-forming fatty acyl-CoA reductase
LTVGRAPQRLSGARILLTGGSGFLGKAVLSALLTHASDYERLTLLLRADDDAAAQKRLTTEILTNEIFAALPQEWLQDRLEKGRLYAVAGDLSSDQPGGQERKGWGEIDTLINCAASVSFEEPLDDAITLNALGPARLVRGLRDAGSDPNVVHVSTAYVADCRVEVVHEDGLPHSALATLDPHSLLEEAELWREAVEAESKVSAKQKHFARQARHGAAQRPKVDVEGKAEELRRRWVKQKLSEQGRQKASELGWPDTYALTKALGERELTEGTERITIIRPSIIESSLTLPRPGWLEGIKVADPLILAYAAGGLTHVAGRARNLIDIVPVDCVANACVIAASHPAKEAVRALAITSSSRNPLQIGELAAHVRAHFRREPLHIGGGAPIKIGGLKFVDRRIAIGAAVRRQRLAQLAAKAAVGPISASAKRKLQRNAALAGQMTRMVKIYAPYTELDCVFDDANACAMAAKLTDTDRTELPFDTAAVDWTAYLERVHLPALQRLAQR